MREHQPLLRSSHKQGAFHGMMSRERSPAPIGASWAANWTLSPVVMCVICMVMSAVIYLPFLRAYERSLMKTEVEKAKNSVPVAETVS